MANRDFVGIQESHSTPGRAKAFDNEFSFKFTSFWSHLSKGTAGIGIIVSNSFLGKFQSEPVWDQVIPGRIAILRLRGSVGSLDLAVCYLDASSSSERIAACNTLAQHLKPSCEVLTMLFGDFNFVVNRKDRWNNRAHNIGLPRRSIGPRGMRCRSHRSRRHHKGRRNSPKCTYNRKFHQSHSSRKQR